MSKKLSLASIKEAHKKRKTKELHLANFGKGSERTHRRKAQKRAKRDRLRTEHCAHVYAYYSFQNRQQEETSQPA